MAEDARQASLDWSPPGISDLDPYSQSDWSLVWSHRVQVAEDARQASLDWSPPGISDLDPYSQSDWSSRLVPSRAG